jgi:hypothetical protein
MGNRTGLLPLARPNGPPNRRATIKSLGVAAVVLLVVVASSRLYQTNAPGPSVPGREYYNGRYWEYYNPHVGPHCILNIGSLNVEQDLSNFSLPETLGIYVLRPPRLTNRTDAEEYLAGFSINVTGYEYHFDTSLWDCHVFENDDYYISVVLDGKISVGYRHHTSTPWEPNITKEEASSIAHDYLMNHTGLPEGAEISVSHDNLGDGQRRCITEFFVRVTRTNLGSGFDMHQMLLSIDAQTGCIHHFQYFWPDIELHQVIPHERLENLSDIMEDFIHEYNEMSRPLGYNSTRSFNITDTTIVYKAPFRASPFDMYEGSPYYVLLPYVQLECDDGLLGEASPLRVGPWPVE